MLEYHMNVSIVFIVYIVYRNIIGLKSDSYKRFRVNNTLFIIVYIVYAIVYMGPFFGLFELSGVPKCTYFWLFLELCTYEDRIVGS